MARSSKLAAVAASAPESETDAADMKSRLDLGELNTHIGYFARRFQVWIFQDLIRELARAEIRISHYSVLAIIEANPGLAQAEVAEAVGIEPARLVRVLDELERRGLDPADAVRDGSALTCVVPDTRWSEGLCSHQGFGPATRDACDRAAREPPI